MSRRVYLVTSNRIEIFDWHHNQLLACHEFRNDEVGVQEFEGYLKSVSPKVTHILVELLEEEFVIDTIPHVSGPDKSNLIQRKLVRHFREQKYTYAKVMGREEKGRRDDELLMTCISNLEPLEVWMEKIVQYQIPVSGIWSLPLLSEELLGKLKIDSDAVLLVSRQMRSALRESVFLKKKLVLSRQVSIDRECRGQLVPESYISPNIDQIHKYLANQRIIPFGAVLDVVCILPKVLIDAARKDFIDTDILRYSFLSLEGVIEKLGIQSEVKTEADVVFANLCAHKHIGTDHYSRKQDRQALYTNLCKRTISVACSFGSVAIVLIAVLFAVATYRTHLDVEETHRQEIDLQNTYNEKYEALENVINGVDTMVESLSLIDRLRNESLVSPDRFFTPLSNILGNRNFTDVKLYALAWEKLHGNELEALRNEVWQKTTPKIEEWQEYPYNEAELDDKIAVVTLKGELNREGLSYRETVATMEAFVRSLQKLDMVEKLMVIKTPVDIRVDSNFTDDSGTDISLRVTSDDADDFEILLLFGPSEADSPSEGV